MNKLLISVLGLGLLATASMADRYVIRDSFNTTYQYTVVNSAVGTSAETKLRAASSAMDSVELNPDHSGFSVSVGAAGYGGEYSAAAGIMYGTKINEYDVGLNVKGYNGEGGYRGGSVGVTIGF